MPEYLAPGVYVEEIGSGIKPIMAASTGTTGFVGQTERGPLTATMLTSWGDYQRTYGELTHPLLSYTSHAIRGFFENGGQRAIVARVVRADAGAPASLLLATSSTQQLRLEAIGPGAFGNRIFARISSTSQQRFCLTLLYYRTAPPLPLVDPLDRNNLYHPLRREADLIESFDNLDVLSLDPLISINSRSQLVRAQWHHLSLPPAAPTPSALNPLALGSDGTAAPSAETYIGTSTQVEHRRGLALLEAIDEISLLAIPDEVHGSISTAARNTIRGAIIHQCETLHDRFGILQIEDNRSDIAQISANHDSSYAAIYYPWIRVYDPLQSDAVKIPACGHIAGIFARTDTERGVHKAPANALLRGILTTDLADGRGPLEYSLNDLQQETLNARGINVIRDFRSQDRGVRVWGARTLSSHPEWRYISVRRLQLFLEQSINNSSQWLVFETNNEPTWERLRLSINNFLNDIWRSGALQGNTPTQAYFVRCDSSTMTQDDINNGRLTCLVGIAAIKPAEFILFSIHQQTAQPKQTAQPSPQRSIKPNIRLTRSARRWSKR